MKKPRNPYVTKAKARSAGAHKESKKSLRSKDKIFLKKFKQSNGRLKDCDLDQ